MKKVIFIIVVLGGVYKFNPGLFDFLNKTNGAFNSDGTPKIMLFIHGDCGTPCSDAMKHIEKKAVAYEVVDVKNNEQGNKDLKRYSKRDTLPILVVGREIYYGFEGKRYNELLYDVVGESSLDWQEREVFKHHFYDDGTPKVVMYGASWCGYCAKARARFSELGIEYVEWDVEKDSDANDRYQVLRSSGYPLIYIGTNRIGSFNESKIIELLKESKS